MMIVTPESTAFCWLAYDDVNHRLTVGFRDQTTYEYRGVPEGVFTLLSSAPSRGRYFNLAIRNAYPSQKVEFLDAPEHLD
ncbi:MAG TPA: KTSC domain-containing protein [Bryobacteraceae bacterium]|jgi:hypothetical protein